MVATVDWWELDRTLEPDHLTSVYSRRWGRKPVGEEMARLAALMDTLRERCPWDRAQTHASLMPHLVEECYEVTRRPGVAPTAGTDAAYAHVEEELGDLLFQIVFHARLADEGGHFDLAGRRPRRARQTGPPPPPRVRRRRGGRDASRSLANWEEIKKDEKGRRSVTEGIPLGLPASMLTDKLARKALGRAGSRRAPRGRTRRRAGGAGRARRADPRPDDPLAVGRRRRRRPWASASSSVADLAQRLGVDAELALRDRALKLRDQIIAAEGVPKPGGTTASLVDRCPTRADTRKRA